MSEVSWPILIKFYLKHHLGGGKASEGFGADWIKILVSTATESYHRLIMGQCCPEDSDFILVGSSSHLQITRAAITFRNSSISGHIGPLFTSKLLTLERWKFCPKWRKCCIEDSAFTFNWIIFKLADNQDSYKIEFHPDRTLHFGVTCHWVPKNAIVEFGRSIACLVLCLWDLQIIRTGIKSRMRSNSGQIEQLTLELLAL